MNPEKRCFFTTGRHYVVTSWRNYFWQVVATSIKLPNGKLSWLKIDHGNREFANKVTVLVFHQILSTSIKSSAWQIISNSHLRTEKFSRKCFYNLFSGWICRWWNRNSFHLGKPHMLHQGHQLWKEKGWNNPFTYYRWKWNTWGNGWMTLLFTCKFT